MSEFPITDEDGLVRCTCETDDLLRLLADASRRRVIVLLENYDSNRIHVDRMAQQLSMTAGNTTAREWHRRLHHRYLPMLEDVGLIEYDSQAKVVRYFDCEVITDVLDVIDST